MAKKLPTLRLGPLPVVAIKRAIGLDLDDGEVIITEAGQLHAAKEHPKEYPDCLPHLALVIGQPLYVGDDLRNPGKIELYCRIPIVGRPLMLVAVKVARDKDGCYRVVTFYPVSDAKIQNRRDRGFVRVVVPG